jgi:hypothetical protein
VGRRNQQAVPFIFFQQRNELCQKILIPFRAVSSRNNGSTIRLGDTAHHTPVVSECREVSCTACGLSALLSAVVIVYVTTRMEPRFVGKKEIVQYTNPFAHRTTKSMAVLSSCSRILLFSWCTDWTRYDRNFSCFVALWALVTDNPHCWDTLLKDVCGDRASVSSTLRSVSPINITGRQTFPVADTSCVPKFCYQSVYCCLIRYFLVRIRTAKCFTNSSKRFRCEAKFENEHTFCLLIHHVRTCTVLRNCREQRPSNQGDLELSVTGKLGESVTWGGPASDFVFMSQDAIVVGLLFKWHTMYVAL